MKSDVYVISKVGEAHPYRLSVLFDSEMERLHKTHGSTLVGFPVYINESRTKVWPQLAEHFTLATLSPFLLPS